MEARGVYREMLTQAWRRGAQLPNDHEAIRRATGATVGEWRRAWPLVKKFWRVDGDSLVNDTQREVYADAQGRAERAVSRARAGAQARHKQSTREMVALLTDEPPISDLRSPKELEQKIKAAAAPPSRSAPENPKENLSVITKIAHEVIEIEGVEADLGQLADAVKSLCAIRGIAYNSDTVRKAVDSALAQKRRSA